MKDDVDGVKKTNSFINLVQFSLHLEQGGLTLRECYFLIKNDAQSLDIMRFPAAIQRLRGTKNILLLYSERKCSTKPLYQENKVSVSMEFKIFTTCGTKACYIGLQCLECDLTLSYSVQIYGKKYSVK